MTVNAKDFENLPQLIRSCKKDSNLYFGTRNELIKFRSYYEMFKIGRDGMIDKNSYLPYGYLSKIDSMIYMFGPFGPTNPNQIDFESMADDIQYILNAAKNN